jgi:hypothetical protein
MQLNVLYDLAEAKRRWTGKKDGAVRQQCVHRDTTLRELDDVEINRKAPQWPHKAV